MGHSLKIYWCFLFILMIIFGLKAQSKLYFCLDDQILKADIDGNNVETFMSDIVPTGLAIDTKIGRLFWSQPNHIIYSARLDGTDTQEALTCFTQPRDIELDTFNQKIYWNSAHTNSVVYPFHRANYDGSEHELIFEQLGFSNEMVLDPILQQIYFTEHTPQNIWKADTDLTNLELLFSIPTIDLRNIAVDLTEEKMYYTNVPQGNIYRSNMDGSAAEVFLDFPPSSGVEFIIFDQLNHKIYGTAYHFIAGEIKTFVFRINADQSGYEILIDNLSHSSSFGNRRIIINHFEKEYCYPSSATIDTTACVTFTAPDNQTYQASGVYEAMISNVQGCDSIITINLDLITVNTEISLQGNTLQGSDTSLNYQWINCENDEPIAGANEYQFTPTQSGNYAAVISNDDCSAHSDCIPVNLVNNIEIEADEDIHISPNPTYDLIEINIEAGSEFRCSVLDRTGKNRLSTPQIRDRHILDLSHLGQGVYYLLFEFADHTSIEKMVKLN